MIIHISRHAMRAINLARISSVLFFFAVWMMLIPTAPSHGYDIIHKIEGYPGNSPTRATLLRDWSELWVSNSGDGTVSVINTASNKVVGDQIRVKGNPGALVASRDGKTLYVGNALNYVSVIDREKKKVIDEIRTKGPVRGMDITPDGKKIYLALDWAGLFQIGSGQDK
jgi:YVTN family beta-propeller protein